MKFAAWMSQPMGRVLRVIAGLVLIGVGLYFGGVWGYAIAAVGLVPALAGTFNLCLIGPILRAPLRGRSTA